MADDLYALYALYADNYTTGGMPPSACRAPMKPKNFYAHLREEARRAEEDRRAKARLLKRQKLYADNQTTGGRPPEECAAPLRKRPADDDF